LTVFVVGVVAVADRVNTAGAAIPANPDVVNVDVEHLAPLARLQAAHNGCRFAGWSVPPRDIGVMWSRCAAGCPQTAQNGRWASIEARALRATAGLSRCAAGGPGNSCRRSSGFHSLRHGYGTALAAQGVPMRTLQEWMGHRDIQTTQRYADYCPNPAERDVVEAAFARGTNAGTNLRMPIENWAQRSAPGSAE
jgi:hypothetical protein